MQYRFVRSFIVSLVGVGDLKLQKTIRKRKVETI